MPSAYAAFRHRPYRLYSAGRILTIAGSQMTAVAVGWQVYERTASPWALGMVGLVQLVPALSLSLWAGQLADRLDRLRIVRASVAAVAACAAALALIAAHTTTAVVPIFAVLFVLGVARGFLAPSVQAALPLLVPAADFANAVGWRATLFELGAVVGPAVGGFLIHWLGLETVYWIDAGLQATGLLLFLRIRPLRAQEPLSAGGGGWLDGVRYLRVRREILAAMALDFVAVLFGGGVAILPIYAKDILQVGAWGLGWLRAAPSIGAVAMALFLLHRPPLQRAGPALLASVATFGAAWAAFGVSTSFALSIACLVLAGMADNISVIIRHTIVQTRTPDRLRGRVSAVNSAFIQSSNQLGAFESGAAAALLGTVPSVAGGGLVTILCAAAAACLWPELRRVGTLADPAEEKTAGS